jgi:Domain of unknown function (DUF4331)
MLRTTVSAGAALALVAGLFVGLGPVAGNASSHREAPLVANDPQIDSTDLYAFVSPDKPDTVTLISNWIPFEEPAGGPNFYWFAQGVHYDINIDNNRDAKPDVIYRWTFTNHRRNANTFLYNTGQVTSLDDADLNFYQTYTLKRIDVHTGESETYVANGTVAPVDVGQASMPDYAALRDAAIAPVNTDFGAGQTYSGPADDPFFLDLRVFDLVYGCVPTGSGCQGKTGFSEAGTDTLHGFNIHTTAIQVPMNDLAKANDASANPLIGVWTTAERKTIKVSRTKAGTKVTHPFVQVDRLGQPLVNEVVIPVGKKDAFNASKPVNDFGFLGGFLLNPELAQDIQALYGVPAPPTPRTDLLPLAVGFEALGWPKFTGAKGDTVPSDELRLNMSIPPCSGNGCSRMGVLGGDTAGYPNGRRLTDDVIDISVQVVEGALIPNHPAIVDSLGDGVNANDVAFSSSFPYLALPHSGSDATPHA